VNDRRLLFVATGGLNRIACPTQPSGAGEQKNNIGTPRVLGLLLAPEMLESGQFFLAARFS
jgi:hypothetical protein